MGRQDEYEVDIHENLVEVFGSNSLWISDAIKRVMQKHKLDTRNKNLVQAMMEVAIGVKKNW